jgi:hypothetical protein
VKRGTLFSSVSPKDEIWFLRVCHRVNSPKYEIWFLRVCHRVKRGTLFSSVSKDEIWFLRVCHHISNAVY